MIVAGVSVALGADAMYDRYQDGLERVRILHSIRADLRLDSALYAAVLGVERNGPARLLVLVDAADGAALVPAADAMRESVYFPGGEKESATYREITASGTISLLEDEDLRESLLRYYAGTFTGIPAQSWAMYMTDVHGAYERSLRRHLGSAYLDLVSCRGFDSGYDECLAGPAARIDLRALAADPDFVELLVGMALWAGRIENFIGREFERHEELSARIDDALAAS